MHLHTEVWNCQAYLQKSLLCIYTLQSGIVMLIYILFCIYTLQSGIIMLIYINHCYALTHSSLELPCLFTYCFVFTHCILELLAYLHIVTCIKMVQSEIAMLIYTFGQITMSVLTVVHIGSPRRKVNMMTLLLQMKDGYLPRRMVGNSSVKALSTVSTNDSCKNIEISYNSDLFWNHTR